MSLTAPEWLLAWLPLGLGWWMWLRHTGRTRWLRLASLWLAPLALAGPRLTGEPPRAHTLVLADRSRSVHGEALRQALAVARELRESGTAQARDGYLLGFGEGASVLSRPGEPLPEPAAVGEHDASELAAGLGLAAAQVPEGQAANLILFSDGLYTGADPLDELPELRERGVRVHVALVDAPLSHDAAIERVVMPHSAVQGQVVDVGVEVRSPVARPAALQLEDARGQVVQRVEVVLNAGSSRFGIPIRPNRTGTQALTVTLLVEGDREPANNRAASALAVAGPPRLLVLNQGGRDDALTRALRDTGLELEVQDGTTRLDSTSLAGVSALVLENMPLSALSSEADRAIEHYVRELGGGLLVTGGRESYAMGGYFKSRLEALLPVVMDRQEELRRPRLDMAVVLDRSGSMAVEVGGSATKMDLANRAAAEALGLLAPGDRAAVLAVDTAAHVVAGLTPVAGDGRAELRRKVLSIESSGGGIFVHTGLSVAMETLLHGDAPTRHILLFADAADAEEPGDYATLVRRWTEAGGSLSVIGLGTPADPDGALLQALATLGGGRAYFTADALQLPRVFAQDVMYVARKTFVEAKTPLTPARGLLALALEANALPSVDGYNLCYLARGAEAMLVSGDENAAPLATGWQRGTGKVLAVTFEADGPHTGAFAGWDQYRPFFREVLEWIKRGEPAAGASATLEVQGRDAVIEVEVDDAAVLGPSPTALIVPPDEGEAVRVPLSWTGPSSLGARHRLRDVGVHHAAVLDAAGRVLPLPPAVVPYSPEFQPARAGRAGADVLERLARATGGGSFTHLKSLAALPAPRVAGGLSLAPWLVGLMLLLALVDVAWRRGLFDAAAARAAGGLRTLATAARSARRTRRSAPPPAPTAGEAQLAGAAADEQAAAPAADDAPGADPKGDGPSGFAEAKRRARRRR